MPGLGRRCLSEGQRPGYSDPFAAYRDDGSRLQCRAVLLDEFGHQRNTPFGGHVRKADQPCMSKIVQVNELSEIGIDGDEYPGLCIRAFEQRFVAGVGTERMRFNNIVPLASQPGREPRARAPVDKESHGSATVTADKVSPATTACA